jgi:hypothetical protein
VPSAQELAHDFLWRVHREVPPKGYIGIFNRSHYEDVLVTRVHGLISDKVVTRRFNQIKEFEELLFRERDRHSEILPVYLQGRTTETAGGTDTESRKALEVQRRRSRRAEALVGVSDGF